VKEMRYPISRELLRKGLFCGCFSLGRAGIVVYEEGCMLVDLRNIFINCFMQNLVPIMELFDELVLKALDPHARVSEQRA